MSVVHGFQWTSGSCADAKMTDVLPSLGQILPFSPRPKASRSGGPLRSSFLGIPRAGHRVDYRILPDAKIAWPNVWVAAGVSALLFLLGNHLIGWYLAATSITSVYASSRFDRDCPVSGLLFFAGRAVRRGVHTSLRQTPRLAPGTKENAMRINRKE